MNSKMARGAGGKNRKEKGINLIEIIVVISIISLLSIILVDVFLAHGRLFNLESADSDFGLQGAQALDAVGRTIRVADKVLSAKTINSENYTASAGTLILEMPSIDETGKVISGSYDYAALFFDGNKIFLSQEVGLGSSRPSFKRLLSDSVGQMKFIYNNNDCDSVEAVFAELTLSKSVSGRTRSFSLSKKFNLGNK